MIEPIYIFKLVILILASMMLGAIIFWLAMDAGKPRLPAKRSVKPEKPKKPPDLYIGFPPPPPPGLLVRLPETSQIIILGPKWEKDSAGGKRPV